MKSMVLLSRADGVARLILNHPPLNILTREALGLIRTHLDSVRDDPTLRVLLMIAEGRHFSAGADVGEHLPPEYNAMIPEFMDTVTAIETFPLPVVVGVQGRCLGGAFELIQVADLVVAGEHASFGQPEIRLGVFPPAACAWLPNRCAPSVAADLVLTGDSIDAAEALRVGLVRRVVPDAAVQSSAADLAGRIARHSAAALRLAKRALRDGRNGASVDAIGELYVRDLMATHDAVEGLQAFTEKREPAWSHR